MSLDKELSGIARFNGDEFHIWKWQMKSLLQYKKIHTIVNGEETLEMPLTTKIGKLENTQLSLFFAILLNAVSSLLYYSAPPLMRFGPLFFPSMSTSQALISMNCRGVSLTQRSNQSSPLQIILENYSSSSVNSQTLAMKLSVKTLSSPSSPVLSLRVSMLF